MVTSKTIASGILKAVFVMVFVFFSIYLLYLIQVVFVYILLALLLTLIGNPILDFFTKRLKFKHLFATIATLLIYVLFIVGFVMMCIPLIASQGDHLALLNTVEIEKNINNLLNETINFLENHQIDTSKMLKETNFISKFNFNHIPNFLNSVVGFIGNFGMGLGSVLFITFFFLKDRLLFTIGIKKLLPDSHEEQILNSIQKTNHLLTRYFLGLLLQLFIVFILYFILLSIFGIQNSFVIAFLCGILNIIPYIGPLIASILAAILTMLSNLGSDFQTVVFPTTIYILIGFWIIQVVDNNVSQPLIFSKSVSSHPLEIFLVILIAGFLFGIVGMIIAVPMYTIFKVIAKEFFPENQLVKLLTKNI